MAVALLTRPIHKHSTTCKSSKRTSWRLRIAIAISLSSAAIALQCHHNNHNKIECNNNKMDKQISDTQLRSFEFGQSVDPEVSTSSITFGSRGLIRTIRVALPPDRDSLQILPTEGSLASAYSSWASVAASPLFSLNLAMPSVIVAGEGITWHQRVLVSVGLGLNPPPVVSAKNFWLSLSLSLEMRYSKWTRKQSQKSDICNYTTFKCMFKRCKNSNNIAIKINNNSDKKKPWKFNCLVRNFLNSK